MRWLSVILCGRRLYKENIANAIANILILRPYKQQQQLKTTEQKNACEKNGKSEWWERERKRDLQEKSLDICDRRRRNTKQQKKDIKTRQAKQNNTIKNTKNTR